LSGAVTTPLGPDPVNVIIIIMYYYYGTNVPIAYAAILQEVQSFENRPILLKEDCELIVTDPIWSEKVQEWMAITSQVATGNRRRVLEDGPDKMSSEDEEIEDMKPDEEPNAYAPGMDPSKGPVMLSPAQVAAQEAAAQDQAQEDLRAPPRSQSPIGGRSDDDDPDGSENVWSQSKGHFRRHKRWRAPNAAILLALPAPDMQKALSAPDSQLALPAPDHRKALPAPELRKALPAQSKGGNVTQEKSVPPPQPVSAPKPKKAAASQKAPAVQKPAKGQESPEAKASKPMVDHPPMVTRRQAASRAGGLRPGAAQGQRIRVLHKATLPKPES
jgi:hypothetical protein